MKGSTVAIAVAAAAALAGIWIAALNAINRMAKLTRGLRAQRGEPLRSSRWGSASINGVNANGCVKIDEYGDGYLLRLMPVFGGGALWLPKGGFEPGSAAPGRAFAPRSIAMASGEHAVVVYGRLADFLERR